MGRCIKELERIYGIYQGGSGYYGNQHEESSNNYKTPKTESDIAKELGISISSLQNYKKLTEMIPELEELVDTGFVTNTTALAIMRGFILSGNLILYLTRTGTPQINDKRPSVRAGGLSALVIEKNTLKSTHISAKMGQKLPLFATVLKYAFH